jgi:hypothetical protein
VNRIEARLCQREVLHADFHRAGVAHLFPQQRRHHLALAAMSVRPRGGMIMSPAVTPGHEQAVEAGPMTAETPETSDHCLINHTVL